MDWLQVMIMITGAGSISLVSRVDKYKKWGFILGLIGQPFWLYTTYIDEQWGIFVMSFVYLYSWSLGVYNHFIKTKTK
jgi:hypothetical protein